MGFFICMPGLAGEAEYRRCRRCWGARRCSEGRDTWSAVRTRTSCETGWRRTERMIMRSYRARMAVERRAASIVSLGPRRERRCRKAQAVAGTIATAVVGNTVKRVQRHSTLLTVIIDSLPFSLLVVNSSNRAICKPLVAWQVHRTLPSPYGRYVAVGSVSGGSLVEDELGLIKRFLWRLGAREIFRL